MIYIGCDLTITVEDLVDTTTLAAVTDATSSAVLKDLNDATIATAVLYADGTGNYVGTIPASVTSGLIPNQEYYLEITTTHDGYDIDFSREAETANYRGFDE